MKFHDVATAIIIDWYQLDQSVLSILMLWLISRAESYIFNIELSWKEMGFSLILWVVYNLQYQKSQTLWIMSADKVCIM